MEEAWTSTNTTAQPCPDEARPTPMASSTGRAQRTQPTPYSRPLFLVPSSRMSALLTIGFLSRRLRALRWSERKSLRLYDGCTIVSDWRLQRLCKFFEGSVARRRWEWLRRLDAGPIVEWENSPGRLRWSDVLMKGYRSHVQASVSAREVHLGPRIIPSLSASWCQPKKA